ncbi:hypothetical protein AJ79_09889 [Helicocarpus griseus UAMH5409]|uniref:Uncharacterized protein n=1 Tax=Helicocarpus griseus UAMH5409 TaxID=1447875 RepID=A0A2B7WGX0_9EURO|nr:hypothetical protein AJ79_09889 [Helicocarpus griseus UAMH5409]
MYNPTTTAFGHESSAPKDQKPTERPAHWLDNQDDFSLLHDHKVRAKVELVIQLQGAKDCKDDYIHLYPPQNNIDIDFESTTGEITIREVTTMKPSKIEGNGGAEELPAPVGLKPEGPEESSTLTVLVHLNPDMCELVKLEELEDTSLLLNIRILDGVRLGTESHQYGFASGSILSPLEGIVRQQPERVISSMQILLPASHIPWKWTAATVLVAFGLMTEEEKRNMSMIYQREMECQYQISEYDRSIPKERSLKELVEEEEAISMSLETLDVGNRREWLAKYGSVVDETAIVKMRDLWMKEAERLRREHEAFLDLIGSYTAKGFEGDAGGTNGKGK